ncbi:hypothetical protein CORC01_11808 [Colletotrichum orchidophilum]|uniref:Uncharacterized protein n=1 Tax=Colletotrichum orchidophilum TaxID=1209926 RepID=A0A1G4AUU5_9PEZI|nr:uncharacterized protein CORC01_11808 [Colletotrichum orchidophilum]OHE92866.1 hypothetical protein CORC01_11808 [Colletotrichum orchidophilum]
MLIEKQHSSAGRMSQSILGSERRGWLVPCVHKILLAAVASASHPFVACRHHG